MTAALTCPPACSAAATTISRMAHDLDDLCRLRDGGAVFAIDLVERGYAQETVDRYGDAAVRMASHLRETRENDGPLCCTDVPAQAAVTRSKAVGAAVACALTAGAVASGAAIVAQSRAVTTPKQVGAFYMPAVR